MTLEDILNNHNVNGEIYRCDIKNFFGWDLSKKRIEELHKTLTQMISKNWRTMKRRKPKRTRRIKQGY